MSAMEKECDVIYVRDRIKHGADFTGRPGTGLKIGERVAAEGRIVGECTSPVVVVEVLEYLPVGHEAIHTLVLEVAEE